MHGKMPPYLSDSRVKGSCTSLTICVVFDYYLQLYDMTTTRFKGSWGDVCEVGRLVCILASQINSLYRELEYLDNEKEIVKSLAK